MKTTFSQLHRLNQKPTQFKALLTVSTVQTQTSHLTYYTVAHVPIPTK